MSLIALHINALNIQIHALYFLALVCGELNKEFLVKNILPSLKYISDQGWKVPLICLLLFSLLLSIQKQILHVDYYSFLALLLPESLHISAVLRRKTPISYLSSISPCLPSPLPSYLLRGVLFYFIFVRKCLHNAQTRTQTQT